ncbi:MAG: hypothetical protein WCW44_00560 [archaeon]|jgi:hypothetical protein
MIKRLEELAPEEIRQIVSSGLSKRTVVAVHPYHNVDPHVLGYHNNNDKFTKYIQGEIPQRALTIVFDTAPGKKILELDLALSGKKTGLILWVETRSGTDPVPIIGWRKLIRKLEELKPKRIIVGGRELNTYSKEDWAIETAELREALNRSTLRKETRISLGEERDYYAAVARAAKIRKQKHLLAGCAGITAAKLTEKRKFKVRTTHRLT